MPVFRILFVSLLISATAAQAIIVSDIQEAIDTLYEAGRFDFDVLSEELPSFLNTSSLDSEIRGFEKTYGANQPVNLSVSLLTSPEITEIDNSLVGSIDINFAFTVKGQTGWVLEVTDASVDAVIDLETHSLSLVVTDFGSTLREAVNKLGFRHNPASLTNFLAETEFSSVVNQAYENLLVVAVPEPQGMAGATGLCALALMTLRRRKGF